MTDMLFQFMSGKLKSPAIHKLFALDKCFKCVKSSYTWFKYVIGLAWMVVYEKLILLKISCYDVLLLISVQYYFFWKFMSLLDFYGQQWVRLPLYHYHNHFYRRQIGQLTHCRFYREQLDPHLLRLNLSVIL